MASHYTATYAPNDVSVVISRGDMSHILSGFSEDSIVTVDLAAARFVMYTGADDTNTRIYQANSSGSITIPLQQTSNSNDILTLLHKTDVETRDSSGMFSILIKDNSGRTTYYASEAYISQVPSASFGNSMQLREWVIEATRLEVYIGGNAKFTPDDAQAIEQLGGTVDPQWVG